MAKRRTAKQRASGNAVKNSKNIGGNTKYGKQKTNEDSADLNMEVQKAPFIKKNAAVGNLAYGPPKGLANLGNTCFFNSVVQNMCRTPGLLYLLKCAKYQTKFVVRGENIPLLECNLPPLCKLSEALHNFLVTMEESVQVPINNAGKQRIRSRIESPKSLFNQICSVAPRFRGYQQQDSQELLQALLDGMKMEEIRRRKQAILIKLGCSGKKATDVETNMRERIKNYGLAATKTPTFVDTLFSGTIVSSVLCDECGKITQVNEGFLDLPIPIVESVQPHYNGNNKKSNKAHKKNDEILDNDNNKSDDVTATPTSKHARKKQRQQSRKNNRRKRTQSQNVEEDKDSNIKAGGDNINNLIDETAAGLENLKIEGHVGTDFSTNKVRNQDDISDSNGLKSENSQLKPEFQDDSIAKQADKLVHHIIEKACKQSCNENDCVATESDNEVMIQPGEFSNQNGHVPELNNNYLLGGKKFPDDSTEEKELETTTMDENRECVIGNGNSEICHTISSSARMNGDLHPDNAENSVPETNGDKNSPNDNNIENAHAEKSVSDVDLNAESTPSDHTEPSSGNDEKEKSGDEITKTVSFHDDGPSLFETPMKKPEEKFTSFCSKLPTTVSPRYEPTKQECSIQSCLHKFTMAEMLTGNNKFGCEECTKRQEKPGGDKPKTVYCNASKQMLIRTPPLILTLQLKRFQQSGRSLRKFTKQVVIPVEFDLSPFCTSDRDKNHTDENGQIKYRIYGIVEHSGSLSRGHYTSYVNVRPENKTLLQKLGCDVRVNSNNENEVDPGQWYHISDTSVSKCTLDRALNSNAYLIFYERIF